MRYCMDELLPLAIRDNYYFMYPFYRYWFNGSNDLDSIMRFKEVVHSMSEEEFQRARKVPRAKTLCRALGLTQEEFAGRYHIPIGTLRDWEQGRAMPDQAARAYLTVIARDPEAVRKALGARQLSP